MNMRPDKKTRLSNPKRLEEYMIDDILSVMSLEGGEYGADVGCGTGLFSLPIAKEIPDGMLYSIDIDDDLITILDEKIKSSTISNIETVKANGYDTPIEQESLDFVFVCVVLHEVPDKEEFLKAYKQKLKDGREIYIVEFLSAKRSLKDKGLVDKEFIKPNEMKNYLTQSGYKNIQTKNLNELVYIMWAQK